MATLKQVCYYDSLLRRVKRVAASEDELAAFAQLPQDAASDKISELEQPTFRTG